MGSSATQMAPRRKRKQRSRPGTHHDVHAPRAGRFVDGGALAAEAAVVRRHCAAGGERAAQPAPGARPSLSPGPEPAPAHHPRPSRAPAPRQLRVDPPRAFATHRRRRASRPAPRGAGTSRGPSPPLERRRWGRVPGAVPTVPRLSGRARAARSSPRPPPTAGWRSRTRRRAPPKLRRAAAAGGPGPGPVRSFFDKRPLDRGGFGGGGDKSYAPPPRPSAAPRARASASGSRVRRGLPVVGPAGCGVQHPVPAGVEAWREGGAQHYGQRHGGCLRDPPAKLDEVGWE